MTSPGLSKNVLAVGATQVRGCPLGAVCMSRVAAVVGPHALHLHVPYAPQPWFPESIARLPCRRLGRPAPLLATSRCMMPQPQPAALPEPSGKRRLVGSQPAAGLAAHVRQCLLAQTHQVTITGLPPAFPHAGCCAPLVQVLMHWWAARRLPWPAPCPPTPASRCKTPAK